MKFPQRRCTTCNPSPAPSPSSTTSCSSSYAPQIGNAPMMSPSPLHLGLDAWSFEDLLFRADYDVMRREKAQTKRLIYSVLCYVQNKSASWSVAMLLRLAVIVVVHQSVNFNRFLSNRFFFPIMMMRSNPSDLTPPELSRVRVLRTGALGSGQSSLLNAGPSQSNGGPWWSLTLGDLCLGFNSLHWIRFLTIHRD